MKGTYVSDIESVGEEDTVAGSCFLVGLLWGDEFRAVEIVLDCDYGHGCDEDGRVLPRGFMGVLRI